MPHWSTATRGSREGAARPGVKREEIFVTTKVPHTELTPPALERAVKQSLANLASPT